MTSPVNSEPAVYILIGKIASGKTYYAGKLAEQNNVVPLSCDELLLTLFNECLGDMHDEMTRRASEYLFNQAAKICASGLGCSLDFGFNTPEQRAVAENFFGSRGIKTVRVYFDPEEQTRLSRLHARNERLKASPRREYIIGERLLARMDAKFITPAKAEYDYKITD